MDRSVKDLLRRVPGALFRLAGAEVVPALVQRSETAVSLPEYRADHVFLVGAEGAPGRWGLHVEYQFQPDPRALGGWIWKNAALNEDLGVPVPLLVIYLRRGRRRTFPEQHTVAGGPFRNEHRFTTTRLWEHAERIRSGELWERAPLLVLCEETPTESVLREERALLALAPEALRSDLLTVALVVGSRYFGRGLVEAVFREELEMLRGASVVEDWILEGEERGRLEGERLGREEGERLGREEGELTALRESARAVIEQRFGPLPPPAREALARVTAAQARAWILRALEAGSLTELGLPSGG